MNMKEFFELVFSYIRRHFMGLVLFSLFAAIFAFVFSLYSLPVEAVAYAALLCCCTGIIIIAVNFAQYYKQHLLLRDLLGSITLSIDELPPPSDIIEKDYINLITALHNEKIRIASEADINRSNMIDYYTLWAHQIKTPIAAMRLLLQSEESSRNNELLMELFKIEQYVEFVLQYLRLENMSSDLVIHKYSLDSIVKQAIRKYARMFIMKKISLDFSGLNCEVLTDEKWLLFVIEQILSNALKYTPEGKISIYMDQASEKSLVIEDTGIGIEAEDLPRVFEKGFTGYNGRSNKKSTGVGLYLCKQILTKLSHNITIESEVGKGTKVKIDLSTVNMEVE